jgi:hypothetical protein
MSVHSAGRVGGVVVHQLARNHSAQLSHCPTVAGQFGKRLAWRDKSATHVAWSGGVSRGLPGASQGTTRPYPPSRCASQSQTDCWSLVDRATNRFDESGAELFDESGPELVDEFGPELLDSPPQAVIETNATRINQSRIATG